MSVKQNSAGRWVVRYRDTSGGHPSRTFTLKKDAEKFERDKRSEVERQKAGLAPVIVKGLTLKDVIKTWQPSAERSVKPRSAERYREHVRTIERHPIASMPLEQVGYAEAQAFVDDMAVIYAPKTVSGIYGVFSLIHSDAAKRGKATRSIPKPRMPRAVKASLVIPTRLEVEKLCEASDARLHLAVALAGYCGLRQGELLALQRDDVNLAEGWVFVHQSRNKTSGAFESTKTDSARRVHMPHRVIDTARGHLDEYTGATLFPVTASIFDKSWRAARAQTGLGRVRFHDLRHAAASMMIHAGWNINQVSKQLGHANPTMTLNVYSHLWPDSFGDAIVKMDEYLDHD